MSEVHSKSVRLPSAIDRFQARPAVALHHQIKEDLFLKMRSGQWPPGHELPGEQSLCEHYSVSRGTLRRALSDLAAEGYIERHRGRGSFVSQPKLESGVVSAYNRFSVVGPLLDAGARVLSCRRVRATRQVASMLRLKPSQSVWQLERLRFTQGDPMSIQASYLPVAIAPDLSQQPLEHEHLVDILREAYGVQLGSATEYVNPTVADTYAAKLLSVPSRAPLFQIERTTCTVTGAVVEYRRALLRGDVYRYRIELR